ncbi:MAG: tRNA pseudouridine(55) synthase TruB [Candidatus Omnitrophica bacterium]|nr:tRNA pseudouridine(55) synthase TruB [Candidatus Omnitrophota bacterium]
MIKKDSSPINGILVINKPSDMTSHDVVDVVRRKFKMKRVGHAGTLDPLATGVLVMLLGKATKRFVEFSSFDKAYFATMVLGLTTDTADVRGKVIDKKSFDHVSEKSFREALAHFTGDIDQIPPMVSALKHNGKRLYQLAREGIKVDLKARRIRISLLELVDFSLPNAKIFLECSKGTYVRKIAEDIGEFLGCGACITQIHRTKVGPFDIKEAKDLNDVSIDDVRKINENDKICL